MWTGHTEDRNGRDSPSYILPIHGHWFSWSHLSQHSPVHNNCLFSHSLTPLARSLCLVLYFAEPVRLSFGPLPSLIYSSFVRTSTSRGDLANSPLRSRVFRDSSNCLTVEEWNETACPPATTTHHLSWHIFCSASSTPHLLLLLMYKMCVQHLNGFIIWADLQTWLGASLLLLLLLATRDHQQFHS